MIPSTFSKPTNPEASLSLRWLGSAGIQLTYQNQYLLIDPCLTRIPFWRLWFGKLQSDRHLVSSLIPRADHILVTHAHYDHLLDVPGLALATEAGIYGSPNACQIARLSGVPAGQIHSIEQENALALDEFNVKVFPAHHRRIPFFKPGTLSPRWRLPFNSRQYRMDKCYSYLIMVGDLKLLVNAGSPPDLLEPVDILLQHPFYPVSYYKMLLDRTQPRLFIPIHWDDLWIPLSQPPRPSLDFPHFAFPPFQRIDLAQLQHTLLSMKPSLRFFIPERLGEYDLEKLIERG